ncbi:o-succinylbenzoate synthase [Eupransor demetentiae]|uniref:o-succinylbenzoate synthase n=1 Tax=Eupransor demetentiae TaxID=3109584 RepID=A0ABM9N3V3_9LACO|nr:L-alanine-DL-glutamate epimerase or related enzyme of enolase superfamily (RspA) [Lactobacillaceae bacterium LMG 33000]
MYQIKKIQILPFALPLQDSFNTAHSAMALRQLSLLTVDFLDLDTGRIVSGFGEIEALETPGYAMETQATSREIIESYLGPALIKQSFAQPKDLANFLRQLTPFYSFAKAGLELAFWDAVGKSTGQSLVQMLGAQLNEVPVGIAIGTQPSFDEQKKKVQAAIEAGYQRIKLKFSGKNFNAEQLKKLLHAFPEQHFSIDANASFTWSQAQQLNSLPSNLLFVEQPFAAGDFVEHARFQATSPRPISLDESINNLDDLKTMAALRAGQALTLKWSKIGGLTAALQAIQYCQAHQIQPWISGMFSSDIGRAVDLALSATLPNTYPADISASDRYFKEDIADEEFVVEGGSIAVPQIPGLGIRPNPTKVEKFQTGDRIEIF